MSDLVFASACQLAQMIREHQVSAVEVLDAYLAQIAKYNSKLNAICILNIDNARSQAKQADIALLQGENWGALHGVPMTVKDLFETSGLRTTAGAASLKDYIPQQDATAVSRLRSAGAILLGKTNVGDLAGGYQGLNDVFPRANNPWNLNYTPGGTSSGGQQRSQQVYLHSTSVPILAGQFVNRLISAASMASSQRIAESLPQDISLKFPMHLAVYVKC
jgi:amidase